MRHTVVTLRRTDTTYPSAELGQYTFMRDRDGKETCASSVAKRVKHQQVSYSILAWFRLAPERDPIPSRRPPAEAHLARRALSASTWRVQVELASSGSMCVSCFKHRLSQQPKQLQPWIFITLEMDLSNESHGVLRKKVLAEAASSPCEAP